MTPEQERTLIGAVGMALCDMVTIAKMALPEGPERDEIVKTSLQTSSMLLQIVTEMLRQNTAKPIKLTTESTP